MVIFNLFTVILFFGVLSSSSPRYPESYFSPANHPENKANVSVIASSKKKPVDIFVIEGCPYCQELEEFLHAKKIEYRRYDIEKDEQGYTLYKKLGGGGVPMVRIGKQIFRGFDPSVIISAYKYGY